MAETTAKRGDDAKSVLDAIERWNMSLHYTKGQWLAEASDPSWGGPEGLLVEGIGQCPADAVRMCADKCSVAPALARLGPREVT